MTVRNSVVTVGTGEVTLFDPATSGNATQYVRLHLFPAAGNSGSVYIGATSVTADTAATGGTLIPAAGLVLELRTNEIVKAIGSATGQKVTVFASGM